jgi:ribosomal protein S18 acetylase RimI-like enzyme
MIGGKFSIYATVSLRKNMKIRHAHLSDEPQIKTLMRSSSGVWQKDWRDDAVEIALSNAGSCALVVEKDDVIIGFASFHDCGFRAYLSEMIIAESEQKKGIGMALLQEGEKILSERGCCLVVADVFPPAVGFYEKEGWGIPTSKLRSKMIAG